MSRVAAKSSSAGEPKATSVCTACPSSRAALDLGEVHVGAIEGDQHAFVHRRSLLAESPALSNQIAFHYVQPTCLMPSSVELREFVELMARVLLDPGARWGIGAPLLAPAPMTGNDLNARWPSA